MISDTTGIRLVEAASFCMKVYLPSAAGTCCGLRRAQTMICLFVYKQDYNPDDILGRLQKDVAAADGKMVGLAVSFELLGNKEIAELGKLAKKIGAEFTIAASVNKRPPGSANFVPYCYVVNSKKAIIYSGTYGGPEFEEAMKEAVTSVTIEGDKSKDGKKDDKPKSDPKKAA